jgi:hypothetical protein
MTDSITPPRELMEQWASEKSYDERDWLYEFHIATRAAQWGAEQELEACCEWLSVPCPSYGRELRNARRPKPPSLKEQALETLKYPKDFWSEAEVDIIRRALESLPS